MKLLLILMAGDTFAQLAVFLGSFVERCHRAAEKAAAPVPAETRIREACAA